MFKHYNPQQAPKVIGPYSHAVEAGPFLFVSGQIPLNPQTGTLEGSTIESQTTQVLKNLKTVLHAAGLNPAHVVRCDIFLTNLNSFTIVNKLYGDFFSEPVKPARQTVEVSALPLGALIEISCIAYRTHN